MSAVMVSMAILIRTFSSGIFGRKRRNKNLILDVTPKKGITWGCIWSVLCMTPKIILNNHVQVNSTVKAVSSYLLTHSMVQSPS